MNILRPQNGEVAVGPGPHPEDRLSIGLVLGGGAARGFAHIGVLRTLMAHGIQPVRQVALDDIWSALRFRPA